MRVGSSWAAILGIGIFDPRIEDAFYRAYADLVVETDRKTPQEVVRMIQEKIHGL